MERGSPPGVYAAGTGPPDFAAGQAEHAHCWGEPRHFSAAGKLPPEKQGVKTFSILHVGESFNS